MNAERWHRIEALFEQALELQEPDRSDFIAGACGSDLQLRSELSALLANATTAGVSLRDAVVAEAKRLADDSVTSHLGRRIGPFRLTKKIGEGGMGAVYLAERDDAQFAHRVAIKILTHAIGSTEAVARFRDERQILAALEHPNIVRLLDGGSTEDDLPYLVMEYIEGQTIKDYAEQQGLPVRARVKLIRQVCSALQYAHQNLVVHRDIKPSNVLVDAAGTPKILDFGIAKALSTSSPNFRREARTRTGYGLFTLEYGSPEQARGDAVSTATDVYSVGAVLYELVTGRRAHSTEAGGLEILRVICEVDPPRPSSIAPVVRRRELSGDLDNIILKALHKEPARRYASVEQLADDLGRWLDGLPVTARTATVSYRAGKFVRRNKGTVVAISLVAATLIAATFVSVRQARRADEQATEAEVERARAVRSADHAQSESDRARKAEVQLQKRVDELTAEKALRASAEGEAERRRVQAESALAEAKQGRELAEQESVRAREAEERAKEAAAAETAARKRAQELAEKERQRADRAEQAMRTITRSLP